MRARAQGRLSGARAPRGVSRLISNRCRWGQGRMVRAGLGWRSWSAGVPRTGHDRGAVVDRTKPVDARGGGVMGAP